MQGVVRSYDPITGEGVITSDTSRTDYVMAPDALERSIFMFVRQGQRVVFELNDREQAINVRTGAEPDLGLGPNIVV
jgi:cold shock CspA family protein